MWWGGWLPFQHTKTSWRPYIWHRQSDDHCDWIMVTLTQLSSFLFTLINPSFYFLSWAGSPSLTMADCQSRWGPLAIWRALFSHCDLTLLSSSVPHLCLWTTWLSPMLPPNTHWIYPVPYSPPLHTGGYPATCRRNHLVHLDLPLHTPLHTQY